MTLIERYPVGKRITAYVSADVTESRFIRVTGNRTNDLISVGPCTAGLKAFGVAKDTRAAGTNVGTFRRGDVVDVTAGGTVTAGTEVESDSTGRAVTLSTGRPCGYAVTGGASGALIQVDLY